MRKFYQDRNIVFTPTHRIAINHHAAICKTGQVIAAQFSRGAVTLRRVGVPHSMVHINHHVLRNALLNSKEVIADLCGIQIVDLQADLGGVPSEPKPVEESKSVPVDEQPTPVPSEPVPTEDVGENGKEDEVVVEEASTTTLEHTGPPAEAVEIPNAEPGDAVATPLGEVTEVKKEDEYQEKLDALNAMTNMQLRERLAGFGVKTNSQMTKKQLVGLFINNHLV